MPLDLLLLARVDVVLRVVDQQNETLDQRRRHLVAQRTAKSLKVLAKP